MNNKIKLKRLIVECLQELLLEVDIDTIPLLNSSSFPKNKKYTPFVYSGMTSDIEDKFHRVCMAYLAHPNTKLQDYLETAYMYILSRNPEIKSIPLNISNYDKLRSPMYDIVYGVASGIPLDDLSYFIIDLKGDATKVPDEQKKHGYVQRPKV